PASRHLGLCDQAQDLGGLRDRPESRLVPGEIGPGSLWRRRLEELTDWSRWDVPLVAGLDRAPWLGPERLDREVAPIRWGRRGEEWRPGVRGGLFWRVVDRGARREEHEDRAPEVAAGGRARIRPEP